MGKDNRYDRERDRDRSPHFLPMRDDRDRRPIGDHKSDMRNNRDHRYEPPPKDTRNFDRGNGNWGHPSQDKNFNTGKGGSAPNNWGKDSWRPAQPSSSDRWNSGNSRNPGMTGGPFSGNSNMNMGPSCPPPPGINNYVNDRFEYKNMGNMRKY